MYRISGAVYCFGFVALAALLGTCLQQTGSGQDAPSEDELFEPEGSDVEVRAVRPPGAFFFRRTDRGEQTLGRKITQAMGKLGSAEGANAQSDAKQELAELLEEYFDRDMEQRAKEIEEIEQRLAKLRGRLEERRRQKQRIIDLQMQVYENEAAGLGFFRTTERGLLGGNVHERVNWTPDERPRVNVVLGEDIDVVHEHRDSEDSLDLTYEFESEDGTFEPGPPPGEESVPR